MKRCLGLILLTTCLSLPAFAGEWEFPGGKIEGAESPEDCLHRELQEEFQVDSEIGEFFMESVHDYGFGIIRLLAYDARLLSDELVPTDHDAIDYAPLLTLGCPVIDTRNAVASRGLPMDHVTKA